MSRHPVAPGCSLIKTKIASPFLPLSNHFLIYSFSSSHLFSSAGAAGALLCRGSRHTGENFSSSVSEIAAIWTMFVCFFCFFSHLRSFHELFSGISLCFPPSLFFLLNVPSAPSYHGERTGSDWVSALIYSSRHWRDLTGCADGLPW